MGRTSDEEGETSTRTCKSDDIDDRPLKKARYVWQIKGKYHLKKPEEEKNSPFLSKAKGSEECSRVAANPCAHVDYQDHIPEYDYQLLGTNKVEEMDVKLDENIRISAREDSSASMINPAGNKVNLNHSSQDVPVATRAEISRFFRSHVASTLLLRKWQARQVARCFVDNTINRVLEDMGFVPLPVDADDIVDEEFPMTESENDDGLEDEAVLMAIHSHGLQRNEGEPSGSSGGNLKEHECNKHVGCRHSSPAL
ncbi:uncharacterized protein [Anabrus simplex]|uniref:uncharacterized protein isoform X2 n=1 Tax=Anabrus simplex TaxID=316456 RepID=UPI0035A28C3C